MLPIDDHNRAFFSPNKGTFFKFSKKGRGLPSPPPSSYAPGQIWYILQGVSLLGA